MKIFGASLLFAAGLLGADAAGKGSTPSECSATDNEFQEFLDLSENTNGNAENACVTMLLEDSADRSCWGRLNQAEFDMFLNDDLNIDATSVESAEVFNSYSVGTISYIALYDSNDTMEGNLLLLRNLCCSISNLVMDEDAFEVAAGSSVEEVFHSEGVCFPMESGAPSGTPTIAPILLPTQPPSIAPTAPETEAPTPTSAPSSAPTAATTAAPTEDSPWEVTNFESVTLFFRGFHVITTTETAMLGFLISSKILDYALQNCATRRLRALEKTREVLSVKNKYSFEGVLDDVPDSPVKYSEVTYWKTVVEVIQGDDKDEFNTCIHDRWVSYFAAGGDFDTVGVPDVMCGGMAPNDCVWLGSDYSDDMPLPTYPPTDAPTNAPTEAPTEAPTVAPTPQLDEGGLATAAIVGISSAGALVALLTFGFLSRKRKSDALLNSNSYETTTLDSGDMFSTIPKKQKAASVAHSQVCHCKRIMCHVCNDEVKITGETTFVDINLLGACPKETGAEEDLLVVVPNFKDMEKALANGDWELLATFANEIDKVPDSNVAKTDVLSQFDESFSYAPTAITDLKSVKDMEIQNLISDQAWADVAELASCIAKGEAAAATIQEQPRPKSASSTLLIREEAITLLEKVSPNSVEHINVVLEEFKGREDELIEQLRTLAERTVIRESAAARRTQGKRNARKQAKLTRASTPTPRQSPPMVNACPSSPPKMQSNSSNECSEILLAAPPTISNSLPLAGPPSEATNPLFIGGQRVVPQLRSTPIAVNASSHSMTSFDLQDELNDVLDDGGEVTGDDFAAAVKRDDWSSVSQLVLKHQTSSQSKTLVVESSVHMLNEIAAQKLTLILDLIHEGEYAGVTEAVEAFREVYSISKSSMGGVASISKSSEEEGGG